MGRRTDLGVGRGGVPAPPLTSKRPSTGHPSSLSSTALLQGGSDRGPFPAAPWLSNDIVDTKYVGVGAASEPEGRSCLLSLSAQPLPSPVLRGVGKDQLDGPSGTPAPPTPNQNRLLEPLP